MNFLDESVTARDAQIAGEEARRRKEIKRTRLTALIFAVAFIFSLVTGVYAYGKKNEAEKALNSAREQAENARRSEAAANYAQKKALVKQKEAEDSKAEAEKQATIARAKTKEATRQKQVAVRLSESVKSTNKSLTEQIELVKKTRAGEELQRQLAEDRRKAAEAGVEQKKLAVARQLRSLSQAEWNSDGEALVRSSLLAVESLKSAWTPEGYEALARGLNLLPQPASKSWQAHNGPLLAMALSHNGRLLATKGTDGTRVWDVASQKEIKYLESPQNKLMHVTVSFSPDDRRLVIGLGRFAYVWDTTTWKELKQLPNGEYVWSVAFSSDGNLMATAGYGSESAIVYETATWTEISKIVPTGLNVFSVVFIPNSRLLVTSANGGTAVWDTTKPPQRLAEIKSTTEVGKPLVLSSDGRWLAIGGYGEVGLWELIQNTDKTVQLKPFVREGSPLWSDGNRGQPESFSSDGRYLITVGADSAAGIWEVASGKEIIRVVEDVTNARFSQDGQWLITGHTDGTVRERLVDANETFRLQQPGKVKTVAYSPDGQWFATGSDDRQARVFQTKDRREVVSLEHVAAVSTVAFSPDSRWLITLNENTMQIFETGSWRKVLTKGYEDDVATVAFSPEGRRLIAIGGKTVQVFVLKDQNWREVRAMEHESHPKSLSFSPDGRWLATKTKGDCNRYDGLVRRTTTRVWDLETGEEVGWVSHEDEDVCHKQSAGLRAPSGGRQALAVESVTWQQAIVVRTDGTEALASRDGQWTVESIKFSKKVELSAANTTGKVVKISHEHVNGFDFSPDGQWLATAGDDGTVRLWPLSREGIIREACMRLPYNLSPEDRKKYLDDPNFPDTCPGLPLPEKKE